MRSRVALAVSAAAGERMTETGLSLGTPYYMNPEHTTADKEILARSDVYSLASVLYKMLTGEPPHMGNSAQQIIMKIIADTPRPVTSLRKSVPPNVAAAVAKALEKLPADRFADAKAIADALDNPAFAIAGGVSAATLAGTADVNKRAFAGVVAIAVLAAVAALWGWLRPGPAPGRVLRYEDTQLAAFITWISLAVNWLSLPMGAPSRIPAVRRMDAGIHIRAWDDLVAMPLAGSEGVRARRIHSFHSRGHYRR